MATPSSANLAAPGFLPVLAAARAWFFVNWMYAGLVAALVLLALLPVVIMVFAPVVLLVFVQLPAYMIHQVEEHAGDRFRCFVNARIGGGREVLSTPAVVAINVPGVWFIYLAVLYLLPTDVGAALIGTYLMLVNAVLHIAAAVVQRCYNPGLWTAMVIFLPLGSWSLAALWNLPASDHAIGLAVAAAVHGLIVGYVRIRAARLTRALG
jgi:hypothetical protein